MEMEYDVKPMTNSTEGKENCNITPLLNFKFL